MSKSKNKSSNQAAGRWMRLLIPDELHTKIRIDGITEKKNLDVKVLEYLQLGYEAHHNGYKGKVNA